MPLYVRKGSYHPGDTILASQFIGGRKGNPEGACFSLILGYYEPFRLLKKNLKIPAITPQWKLDCYADRTIMCLEAFDSDQVLVTGVDTISDGEAYVRGAVFGKLDMDDWYEVRSYLLRCLWHLRPMYEARLYQYALAHL